VRLVLTTADFRIHGVSYAGFPLLLDDGMNDVEPASSFLQDICLRSGRVASPASWKKYGRDLYDFFSFVPMATEPTAHPELQAGQLDACLAESR